MSHLFDRTTPDWKVLLYGFIGWYIFTAIWANFVLENPYEDNTGHSKGYEWAENYDQCATPSSSFNEGCERQLQHGRYFDLMFYLPIVIFVLYWVSRGGRESGQEAERERYERIMAVNREKDRTRRESEREDRQIRQEGEEKNHQETEGLQRRVSQAITVQAGKS